MKVVFLSSDTIHHRFFLNKLLRDGIDISLVIFETSPVIPQFEVGPFHNHQEDEFEKEKFSKDVNLELTHSNVVYEDNVNELNAIKAIKESKADTALVFGTGLIKPSLIELFDDRIINIHRGIAQEYRGLDSDLWALYHEDYNNLGVTIHRVTRELDKGEISYQKCLNLDEVEEIFHLRYHTTLIAYDLVLETLRDISLGTVNFIPQVKFGRYYSFMPLDLKRIAEKKFIKFKNLKT